MRVFLSLKEEEVGRAEYKKERKKHTPESRERVYHGTTNYKIGNHIKFLNKIAKESL